MEKSGILFCLVAGTDNTIITEASRVRQGTVALNAKKVFNSIPKAKAEKRSYNYSGMCYNMMYDSTGAVFLAVTDENFSRVQCFAFLEEMKKKFAQTGRNAAQFLPELKRGMEYFSDPANDKFAKLKENIETVKGVMIENIDKMIERGEKIDAVVEKTDVLAQNASTFQTRATTLKRKMWQKKCLLTLGITLIVLIIIFVVVLFACSENGVNFHKCFPPSQSNPAPPGNHTTAPGTQAPKPPATPTPASPTNPPDTNAPSSGTPSPK